MAVISKRDSGRWQARIRRDGWPSQSKTFRTRTDAEAWARVTEREMDVGAFINRDDAERTTFAQAADRYAREVLPAKRGAAQDQYRLAQIVEAFGEYSLAAISSSMLAEYRDQRLKAVSPQTAVHELGLISRVFKSAAMDWGIALPRGNPVALVRKPAIANARTRRLEDGEEALLMAALDQCQSPWPKAMAVLAIETAARMSELLSLQWKEVDLKARTARLRGKSGGVTKSGAAFRDVPLSSAAVECLRALPRSVKGRVIPLSQNALQLSWERATARARTEHVHAQLRNALARRKFDDAAQAREIRALTYHKREPLEITRKLLAEIEARDRVMVDLHFHDLRHEGTSRLAEHFDLAELMKITGHSGSRMLARYYHPRAADLAKKLR